MRFGSCELDPSIMTIKGYIIHIIHQYPLSKCWWPSWHWFLMAQYNSYIFLYIYKFMSQLMAAKILEWKITALLIVVESSLQKIIVVVSRFSITNQRSTVALEIHNISNSVLHSIYVWQTIVTSCICLAFLNYVFLNESSKSLSERIWSMKSKTKSSNSLSESKSNVAVQTL